VLSATESFLTAIVSDCLHLQLDQRSISPHITKHHVKAPFCIYASHPIESFQLLFATHWESSERERASFRIGAATWIYNEFSCLARVRIRKAKVPGSKGWEMVAVKGKKEVKKDGGEEGKGWGCNVDL
jgi:hypothetical protein